MKYIFEIKIKSGYTIKDYTRAWKEAGSIIQKEKGAQGTPKAYSRNFRQTQENG